MEVVAEVAVSGEARVFFLGWQSWSLSGTLRLGQPGSPARTLLAPAVLRETTSQCENRGPGMPRAGA
jgi:hypothetical protein